MKIDFIEKVRNLIENQKEEIENDYDKSFIGLYYKIINDFYVSFLSTAIQLLINIISF